MLCSLIHDSQEDKKGFVMDLKQTYESFLEAAGKKGTTAERQRSTLLQSLRQDLQPIQSFFEAMRDASPDSAISCGQLLDRLLVLQVHQSEIRAADKDACRRMPPGLKTTVASNG